MRYKLMTKLCKKKIEKFVRTPAEDTAEEISRIEW